ncbi:class I SAM-dependent methyltransferase [Salinisphaera orenii]|uniref:class I SAM-dependent methyltransferase n=1 Tax=Salinisphaera orenii TaxID=856731 RepID=UPI000F47928D|nr:class I SAM-dependent methyltransferase [Salinisphaera halophila]
MSPSPRRATPAHVNNQAHVDQYAAGRYRSPSQRFVNWREHRIARELLAHSADAGSTHVVDIPCGYGRFYPLYKTMGYQVTCLDRSDAMIEWLRSNQAQEQADRERVQRADILDRLPVDTDVDLAVSIRMFQHIPSRESRRQALAVLAEAGNGPVLMTYYDRRCLHYWTKRMVRRLRGKRVGINMLSGRTMDSDIESAGLKVVRRKRLLWGLHAQTWVLLEWAKKPVRGVQMALGGLLAERLLQPATQLFAAI